MAKTAGGVRLNQQASTKVLSVGQQVNNSRQIENVQKGYAEDYINKIGGSKQSDVYHDWDDKRLKKFIELGKSYNEQMRSKAVEYYTEKASKFSRKTGRNTNHIEHAELKGARSELIKVGQAYHAYQNMQLYKDELKRRKKK